jgi:predicted metal-dependent hydrolase
MHYKLIVIKKSVKHMRLRIKDHQTVEVVAPRLMPRFVINRFVRSKKEWIHKHIDKLATVAHELSLKDDELLLYGQKYHLVVDQSCSQTIVDDEKHTIRTNRNLMDANTRQQWYTSYAKKVLTDKITAFADETGICFHKLFIRSQKTKW